MRFLPDVEDIKKIQHCSTIKNSIMTHMASANRFGYVETI